MGKKCIRYIYIYIYIYRFLLITHHPEVWLTQLGLLVVLVGYGKQACPLGLLTVVIGPAYGGLGRASLGWRKSTRNQSVIKV